MTVAPSAWNSLAVAAPMPVVPPVIRAILPSSFAVRKLPVLVSRIALLLRSEDEPHIWTYWSERKRRLANDGLRRRTLLRCRWAHSWFSQQAQYPLRVRKRSN